MVTLLKNAFQFAVGCLAVAVVSVLISIAAGLSTDWGRATIVAARTASQADVFTTVTAARGFANPFEAMAAFVLFAAVALLSSSIAYTAACVSGRARVATSVSIVLYLWSACCAFGAASMFPQLDAVNLYDYAWARAQGSAYVVLVLWAVVAFAGIVTVMVKSISGAISDVMLRWWSIAILPIAAFGFSIGVAGTSFAGRWDEFFAGEYDSLVGYCRVACLIYVLASMSVVQYLEATDDQLLHVKIRYGSRWHWLRPHLTRALLSSAIGGSLISAAVALSLLLHTPHLDMNDARLIGLTTVGLIISLWIVTSAGLLVTTVFGTTQSWIWAVGICFVAGYSAFIPLGRFDVFALYSASLSEDRANPLESYLSGAGFLAAVVLALLALGVWAVRPTYTSRQAPIG